MIAVGQTTIFNFVEPKKNVDEFIAVEDVPEFIDVDLSTHGPYRKGDIIKRGEFSDRMLEILLQRGLILPKR